MSTKQEALREQILRLQLPTVVSRVKFFPDQALPQVLDRKVVTEVIEETNIHPSEHAHTVDDIFSHAQKIFCILVCIREVGVIDKLLQNGYNDQMLALSKEKLEKAEVSESVVDDFYGRQWEFIAPIPMRRFRMLDPSCILPFKGERRIAGGEGGYGIVWKVELYSCHQLLVPVDPGDTVVVARKELKYRPQRSKQDFDLERRSLQFLEKLGHPHIIELLGSYHQNESFCFFLSLAEGSLKDLFNQGNQKYLMDNEKFYSSIVGLSSAISHIHNFTYDAGSKVQFYKGYHHDLKPGNILVSKGRLVIADFGLSKFKDESKTSSTLFKAGTKEYLPPEAFNDEPEENYDDTTVGRSVDIWAFGCILSEIATYMLCGTRGVSKFGARRMTKFSESTTDSSFHARGKLKEEVKEWLKYLEDVAERDSKIWSLIKIIWKILVPEPKRRPNAQDVLELVSVLDQEAASRIDEIISDRRDAMPPSPPVSPTGSPRSRPILVPEGGIEILNYGSREPELQIDVVALHGLNGGSRECWEGTNGSIWLRDFLPSAGMHNARIISYGYNAESLFTKLSQEKFGEEAEKLLHRIHRLRTTGGKVSTTPIVFLAHSIGGLLLKQAILLAEENGRYRDLFKSVCGLTFFGTPHREHAIQYTLGACLRKIARTASAAPEIRARLEECLSNNERLLKNVNSSFKTSICTRDSNLRVLNFCENKSTPGIGMIVVDRYAATIGLQEDIEENCDLELSHPDLCKYSFEEETSYQQVSRKFRNWVRTASDEYRETKRKQELANSTGPYQGQVFGQQVHVSSNYLPVSPHQQPFDHRLTPQPTQNLILHPQIPDLRPQPMTQPSHPQAKQAPPPPPPPKSVVKHAQTSPQLQPPPPSTSIGEIEAKLREKNQILSKIGRDFGARLQEKRALKPRRQEKGEAWFTQENARLDKRIAELERRRAATNAEKENLIELLKQVRKRNQTT